MYINTWEKNAEQNGWKVFKVVETKEEAIEIINQLRKLKIQCTRARHINKTIDSDLQFIWVNPATLDKPYKRKTRPVDKTNKKNIKCFNCKHWDGDKFKSKGRCVLTNEEKMGYQMKMKCFEWKM
jgi:hypothetical protein